MEDIERFIKISQQKRLLNQQKLKNLDDEPEDHKKLMKELRDLKRETQQSKENITKHLNTIKAHKHIIHKMVHSSEHISGLPISHNNAQEVRMMFAETINFLNNIGDTCEALNNVKEKDLNPSELIEAVTTCTEAVGNELYETRCCIAQLEALKEDASVFQQYISDSSRRNSEETMVSTTSGESTDSRSTVK